MNSLYRDNILDHYRHPRNFGHLQKPDAKHEEYNEFCGDRIGVELRIKNSELGLMHRSKSVVRDSTIEEIRFYGSGCAISMASASMLTEAVLNKPVSRIRSYTKDDVLLLLGIELTPTRLKCALLSLEVLHKALALVNTKGSSVSYKSKAKTHE